MKAVGKYFDRISTDGQVNFAGTFHVEHVEHEAIDFEKRAVDDMHSAETDIQTFHVERSHTTK